MAFRSARVSSSPLARLPVFADVPPGELRRLDALTCAVRRPARSVLTRQGRIGREAFIVLSGTADVQVSGRTVARIGPGEVIGELALLSGEPRTATVSALTDMELLVLDPAQFAELLRDEHVAARVEETARLRRRAPAP